MQQLKKYCNQYVRMFCGKESPAKKSGKTGGVAAFYAAYVGGNLIVI